MSTAWVTLAAAAGIFATHLALRIAPIWRTRHQGCDAYFYLFCAEAFRRDRALPIVLAPLYLLEPREQAYPPMMSMLLGLLPEAWLARSYWAISPLIDGLTLLLIAAWIGSRYGLGLACLAALAYTANASLALEFGALSSRPLALFETTAFLLASFAWTEGSSAALLAAIVIGAIVLYTHKLSAQLLWFLMPFLAVAGADWRWVVPLAGAYLAAFAAAPHLFRDILRGHWDIVTFWHRNWRWLGAHIVRQSPLYRAEPESAGYYRSHTLSWVVKQAEQVLNYNCFLLFVPFALIAPVSLNPVERFSMLWASGTFVWGCATYFVTPLRCLGEGNKYFKYALAPALLLAAACISKAPGLAAWALAAFCGAWTLYAYARTARRLRGAMPTGRLTPALARILDRLRADDSARIMCLPTHLCDLVAWHARRAVLWGTHGLGFTTAEPFFPILRKPIEAFVRDFALTHLLVDEHYVTVPELRLAGGAVVCRSENFVLLDVRAAAPP